MAQTIGVLALRYSNRYKKYSNINNMKVEIQGTNGGEYNSKNLALVKVHAINNDSNASVVVDSYVGNGDGHNRYRERDIECISVTNRNGDTIEVLGIDKLYDLIQKANHTIVGTRYLSV